MRLYVIKTDAALFDRKRRRAGLTLTNEAAQSSVLDPKYPAQVLFTFFLLLLSMLLSTWSFLVLSPPGVKCPVRGGREERKSVSLSDSEAWCKRQPSLSDNQR